MNGEALRTAVGRREAMERSEGWRLVTGGLPAALVDWVALSVALWSIQLFFSSSIPWDLPTAVLPAASGALAVLAIDGAIHSHAAWRAARYYRIDDRRSRIDVPFVPRSEAAARSRLFAGSRAVQRGLAKLALARRLADPRLVASTREFLGWVLERGDASLAEAHDRCERRPAWAQASALAFELRLARTGRDEDHRIECSRRLRG